MLTPIPCPRCHGPARSGAWRRKGHCKQCWEAIGAAAAVRARARARALFARGATKQAQARARYLIQVEDTP